MDGEMYEGVVRNGVVCLLDDVRLAENTRVMVSIVARQPATVAHVLSPRLVHPEQAKDFEKLIIEDAADE